jgi:hypothetical protein
VRITLALIVLLSFGLAGCNPDDRRSIIRQIVRVPVAVPSQLLLCDPPLSVAGITSERQLARRTIRNEQRHWRCVRSIDAVRSLNADVRRRSAETVRAHGEVY